VNIDRSLGTRGFPCHPDVVADIRRLPWTDESVDAVYAGHVLEHIPYEDGTSAVAEMRRVLKPGGRLCIVGPDMDRCVGEFADLAPCVWPGMDGDWATWEGAGHEYCSTATNTRPLISAVFPDVVEVPMGELDEFWPPTNHDGWQFAFLAVK
jgi:SAM-dependent methyltransferase